MAMTKFANNLSKFKLITFDVTETLLNFRRSPGEEYAQIAAEFDYNIDASHITQSFRPVFREISKKHPNFGRDTGIGWENWWRMLIKDIFLSSGLEISNKKLLNIADTIINRYETGNCWTKVDRADELIQKLKDHKKIVGIISNYDPRLKFLLENMKFPKFDFVIASYEVGAAKPDPAIFDLAIKLGWDYDRHLVSSNALHIGNTPSLDYVAAIKADWNAALITNGSNEWKQFEEIKENCTFKSIADFLHQLEHNDIQW